MWIIRAGKASIYYDKIIETHKVFIPWEGYKIDFSNFTSLSEIKTIVISEKNSKNRTSISNWAGQIYSFVKLIQNGDYILIPSKFSRTYCLAKIVSNYRFDINEIDKLYHSRNITIIEKDIPRSIFSQNIIYSLGAFRTIFKTQHEDEIIKAITKWRTNTNENTV